jgi:C2 domain of PTEN tumour-suppressor protein
MNTIPRFGTRNADGGSSSSSDTNTADSNAAEGCCPYIQVFKGGRLVFTTTYVPSHDTRHTPHAITAAAGTDTTATAAPTASAGADATAVIDSDQQSSDAAAGDSSADPTTPPAVAATDTDTAGATTTDTTAADNNNATTAADSSSSAAHTSAEPPAAAAAAAATPAAAATTTAAAALPWAYTSDESIAFSVDCVVQGDLLLRCRHLGPNGQRVSMFRAAFHTGYVPCGVLRLSKAQLDGACGDPRFDEVSLL